ncbi:ABC transporter ATP-binding protein [Hazenella coriacea]|uniref:Putative ABC transport system ATP-binding protein n=1 Tax=Hazenella coriacea TaxID=1179467 RepID=A0A4V2UUS7_9BACL|nr:ABC transporter ATP-binding protein [Hazenella coriacea]TCS92820.1 putative ABC transport system ATP-binding protein [Hazenella coriacea]
MIQASELWKVFGKGEQRVEALRGLNLSIQAGEIVAVMGPSGCGKTSLLNCLSGLDHITQGSVEIAGQNIHRLKEKKLDQFRAEQMGFVFQAYNLIPVLSAVENVELPLLAQGIPVKKARVQAEQALGKVGLRNRAHHLPTELSGGQAQRVALARAIVNQPKVIWADEPTGALDRETSQMVLDLFDHINRTEQTTIVIVTHDPKVAEQANRIVYMDSGVIVKERLTQRPTTTKVKAGEQR